MDKKYVNTIILILIKLSDLICSSCTNILNSFIPMSKDQFLEIIKNFKDVYSPSILTFDWIKKIVI